jgi:hypothetical protein
MSAPELADATRQYEGMVIDKTKPLSAEERKLWKEAKSQRANGLELRYHWKRLNQSQVGRYAEYFAKMEFALYGFEVFTTEVDDRGIDFVARKGSTGFLEIQVKAMRDSAYTFLQKDKFPIRRDRLLALVLLMDGKPPEFYLIPATAWRSPNDLLKDRNGGNYRPEWGIQLSKKSRPQLARFRFEQTIAKLANARE